MSIPVHPHRVESPGDMNPGIRPPFRRRIPGFAVCPEPPAAYTLRDMRRLTNHLLVAILASPFAATAMAFAQSAPRDPNIGQAQRTPIWLGYLVAGIFATILVVLTLFPSKRQSEDV